MPRLLQSSETVGCGATIKLDNGDVVHVSISRATVTVRQWDLNGLIQTLTSNFFGRKLYKEGNVQKNVRMAEALTLMYPDQTAVLPRFKNPVLTVFVNVIWHCDSAAEVGAVLDEAKARLPQLLRR